MIYRGVVVRLDIASGQPWVEVPLLAQGHAFGPCQSLVEHHTFAVGDSVVCGALSPDVVVIIGLVEPEDHDHATDYQPLDSDLTALAALTPTNDDILQRKAGAWSNRTPAQVKTDMVLVKGDVGLGNVDNTSDANKPVSTAQQAALDAKAVKTFSQGTGATQVHRRSNVVAYSQSGPDLTGTLMIDTNISFTSTLFDITVRGFNYYSGETLILLELLGNAAAGPVAVHNTVFDNGSGRIAGVTYYSNAAGKLAIGLTTTTDWDYTKLVVDALIGHTGGSAAALDGWTITRLDDLTGYTQIVVPTIRKAMRANQNLADLANTTTARTNLGLGTAAVVNTGTDSGNVPVLDANGNIVNAVLPDRLRETAFANQITDFNDAGENGWYRTSTSSATNRPIVGTGFFTLRVDATAATYCKQVAWLDTTASEADAQCYVRYKTNSVWGAWHKVRVTDAEFDARYERIANKGAANGYASLDGGGKVPVAQLPSSLMQYQGVWDASTNSPTLADGTGDTGDVYRVTVGGTRNLGSGNITFDVGDYVIYNGTVWEKSDTTDAVASVAGKTGVVTLVKADVGLALVDNTADSAKPVSTAQQQALDGKQSLTGKNQPNGYVGTDAQNLAPIDRLPTYPGPFHPSPSSSAVSRADHDHDDRYLTQTDASTALAEKMAKSANLSDLANIATAKTNLGLNNVDNTSDANKPISTAQQTALDAKQAKMISATLSADHTDNTGAYATVLSHNSVVAGKTYRVRIFGTYMSDTLTNGVFMRINSSGTFSAVRLVGRIYGETAANTPNIAVTTAIATAMTTTAVAAINTPYLFEIEGLVRVSATGTFVFQVRSEGAGPQITIHKETAMFLEEVS